jgi:hypothetical protein
MELESTSSQNPAGLYWPRVNLQTSEGPEHTKAVMCRTKDFKYVHRLYESDELYDLRKSDPPLLTSTETLEVLVSLFSLPVEEGNELLEEVIK